MRRQPLSLLRRAALLVGMGILIVWVGMMVMLYLQVAHEVDELHYAQLTDFGHLLLTHLDEESQLPNHATPALSSHTTLAFALYDQQGQLLAQSHKIALPLPAAGATRRFYDQTIGGMVWRCAVFADAQRRVVVAQPASLRQALAAEIAIDLLTPIGMTLFLLLPLAIIALWLGLRPLRQFDTELDARSPSNLAPLATHLPAEIAPIAVRLNHLFARIEETLAREKRFTGDAAHELRTPIAALQVQLEVASTSPRPQARERALGNMQQGIDRLGRLVTQLLALARLDDNEALPLQQVDVPALARQVLGEVDVPGTVTLINAANWQAEPDILGLLLRNLFENSKRYGGSEARLAIQIDGAQITIRDFGPGVASEWLARLGERFARPPGQTQSGSGLGLSIVARAAERMGGSVQWENAADGGFVVTLTLQTA